MTEYVDVQGKLWFAQRDLENPGLLPSGGEPWEVGYFDVEGVEIVGDWMTEAEALGELADLRRCDEQRAEDDCERRFYGD